VVDVGVADEDRGDLRGRVRGHREVGGDEVGPVDVQLRDEVQVDEVVDAPRVPVLEELLVEHPVLPEILSEVEEDVSLLPLDQDLVPPDPLCPVIGRD